MEGVGFLGVLGGLAVVGLIYAALGPFAIGLPLLYMIGIHPIVQGYRSTMDPKGDKPSFFEGLRGDWK
jgi:hypothetical protein